MKKFFLMLFMAFVAVSCSNKVDVKGKIVGASPMERVEFIDASDVATLPLINLPVSPTGDFSGNFQASHDGMYVMTYAGKMAFIYLEKGQALDISANAATFPEGLKIAGEAGKNYEFMKENQKFFQQYASKINVGQEVAKDDNGFLKSAQKIYTDLEKHIDETASKLGASNAAKQWKKDEMTTNILAYVSQYEMNHGQLTGNPGFKAGKAITDYEKKLSENSDRLIEEIPDYRKYLLQFKLAQPFQKYAASMPPTAHPVYSEIFAKFMKGQSGYSDKVKNYLLGFVATQDLHLGDYETAQKVNKVVDESISDNDMKKRIKDLAFVIGGYKPGTQVPSVPLKKMDGSSANLNDLKGKPTLVMFYASWNPYVAQTTMPILKEVMNFYKSKVNFAFVNMDDTKEQAVKTSNAMLKGLAGATYYADGGLNSEAAKTLGIYGFKLPGFFLIDKDGKFVGKYFTNLGEPDFVAQMDKISGLKAPMVSPNAPLPGGMIGAQPGMAPPPAPQQQPDAPAKEAK